MLNIVALLVIPVSMIVFSLFYDEKKIRKNYTIRYKDKIEKQEYWEKVSKQNKKVLLAGGIVLLLVDFIMIYLNRIDKTSVIVLLIIQLVTYSVITYIPKHKTDKMVD